MQFTGVDKFFRGKISQYKKCIFWKKKVTKDWHYLQSAASISPPELAFQFTYSSMYTTRERDIRKIRHLGPGCSGVWILRVFYSFY